MYQDVQALGVKLLSECQISPNLTRSMAWDNQTSTECMKKKNQIAASATFLTPNLPVIEYTRLKIKIVKNREI